MDFEIKDWRCCLSFLMRQISVKKKKKLICSALKTLDKTLDCQVDFQCLHIEIFCELHSKFQHFNLNYLSIRYHIT